MMPRRTFVIETYGCQMNVHDSERMAGLLEQRRLRGRSRRGRAPTSSSSTPAACANAPRRSSTRASANSAQAGAESSRRPVVAVAGCVAQQEGDTVLKRARRRRRHRRHAGPGRLPMLRRTAPGSARGAAHRRRPSPRTCPFPLGVTRRRRDPVRGLRDHHRGLQRVLRVLRRAVHARPRAHAARRPRSSPRCGRPPATGAARGPAARADREPLPGARRPGLRLRGAAGGGPRGPRHRADPVRQPASAARHSAADRRPCASCRRSAGTCTCRCSPARRACSTRCGGATRAKSYLELVARVREAMPDVALIDRYDRWLPRGDRRRTSTRRCR